MAQETQNQKNGKKPQLSPTTCQIKYNNCHCKKEKRTMQMYFQGKMKAFWNVGAHDSSRIKVVAFSVIVLIIMLT